MSAVLPQVDLRHETRAEPGIAAAASLASIATPDPLPLTPVQRLALSRMQLRAAMFPPPPPASKPSAGLPAGWLSALKSIPGVDIVIDAAHAWWYRHPLKPMSDMAGQASKAAIQPIAQRHPFALVLAAASVGVLIASLRPWRWALRSALFAGFLPQMLSRLVTKLPFESWLAMLSTGLSPRSPPVAPASTDQGADRSAPSPSPSPSN